MLIPTFRSASRPINGGSNFNGFRSTRYDAVATTVTTPLSQPVVLTERTDFGVPNNDGSQPDGTNARRFQVAIRIKY